MKKEEKKKAVFIKRRKDFVLLRKKGKRETEPGFFIVYRVNSLSYSRFALFFPKWTGKAVQRNLFKRWSRHFIRERNWPVHLDLLFGFEKREKSFYKTMDYKRFFSGFEKTCRRIKY